MVPMNGPQIADIDPNQIVLGVFGIMGTWLVSAWRRDHKDSKKDPITVAEKVEAEIKSGDAQMAYVLGIAQRAEGKAAKADERVKCLEGRYSRLVEWAQSLVANWSSVRRSEHPPEIPADALPPSV